MKKYLAKLCNLCRIGSFLLVINFLLPQLPTLAATSTNPAGTTVTSMNASSINSSILKNYGKILGGASFGGFGGGGVNRIGGMFGYAANNAPNYDFLNAGDISITTNSTQSVHAMYAASINSASHKLINDGSINVIAQNSSVDGMHALTDIANTGSHILVNNNSIVLSGKSGNGMYASGNGNHELVNTGLIDATFSNSGGSGMSTFGAGKHILQNTGTIKVRGKSNLYGMSASTNSGSSYHYLTNHNIIDVTVEGNSTSYAMHVKADNYAYIHNYGTITSTSQGGSAYGMHADVSNGNIDIVNIGDIVVSGGGARSTQVYAMFSDTQTGGSHNLYNSGNITVTATNASGSGMHAYSNFGTDAHTLTNHGNITVNATGDHNAYGMAVLSSVATGKTHTLNNYGVIKVSAPNGRAFEAYSNNNYSIGTWATTLRTWSATKRGLPTFANIDAVFGVATNKSIHFNNTKFILRAGTAEQGFVLGKDYSIQSMAYTPSADPAILTGSIASAEAEVGFYNAVLTGTDPRTATVRLEGNVSPSTTPGSATNQQTVATVQGQMLNIGTELRKVTFTSIQRGDTGASRPASSTNNNQNSELTSSLDEGISAGSQTNLKKWQFFLTPYANFTNNTDLNFDGNNVGLAGGVNYRVSENFSFGGHFDFNVANYNANVMDTNSSSTSIALGLQAAYNILPEWYIRTQLTGGLSNTESNYFEKNGTLELDSNTNYNSKSIYIALASGYVFNFNENHSLTPEIGISYLSSHTDAYDIEWAGTDAADLNGLYDLSYGDFYYNAFFANINLDWRSTWDLQDDASIALIAGLGLRQKLSNNSIETNLRTLGTSFTTRTTEDATTMLANVGIEYSKDNFSISLNYNGGYSYSQTNHGGNILFKLDF